MRWVAAALFCGLALFGLTSSVASAQVLSDPAVLQRLGLQKIYQIGGKSVSIDVLTLQAQERAKKKFLTLQLTRDAKLARNPSAFVMSMLASPAPQATPLVPVAPATLAPLENVAPTSASTTTAISSDAGSIASFFVAFEKQCLKKYWLAGKPCYVDVTSGTVEAWSAPPAADAPQAIGFSSASATPSPLPGVAETTLSVDIAAARSVWPDKVTAAPSPLPTGLSSALTDADRQGPIIKNSVQIPKLSSPGTVTVPIGKAGSVLVTLTNDFTPPDFFNDGAAYGSTLTSTAAFALQLNLPWKQTINISTKLATLEAGVSLPTNGKSVTSTLAVNTDILGTQRNLISDTAAGPSLGFKDTRESSKTEDPCVATREAFMISPAVDLTLQLSCPVTFGYWLGIDADLDEASLRLAPGAAVGLGASGEVNAGAGLLVVSADVNENALTLEGRVGAYADLVCNPQTFGQPGAPDNVYALLRPYAYGEVTSGDGYFYVVAKVAGTATYIKLADWNAKLNIAMNDPGKFSAVLLTSGSCGMPPGAANGMHSVTDPSNM